MFLDDLQWGDEATLELLLPLAAALEARSVLVLGAYRSDEIPRGHPLRRLRRDLRRAGRLRELVVEPLDTTGTAELARQALGAAPSRALVRLMHALGEVALLEDDVEAAALHFDRALELMRPLELPFETAQTQVRSAAALALAGEHEAAVERLTSAYRTARKLRARPLGRAAAAQVEHAGLTRRELEVMRLVAVGGTNREIARDLFLSPRTIDMHVRNIFGKLDCLSRAEATHKAFKLGLIAPHDAHSPAAGVHAHAFPGVASTYGSSAAVRRSAGTSDSVRGAAPPEAAPLDPWRAM